MDDKYIKVGPVADSVPYDQTVDPDCELDADTVQEAIDKLCIQILNAASPGFTWGRSGTLSKGTWLKNDTVPSNRVGRRVSFQNAAIKEIAVTNDTVTTYKIEIYEHDGTTFTLLHTVDVNVASRGKQETGLNVAVTTGKELAVRVAKSSPNNPKNVDIAVQLKGTL